MGLTTKFISLLPRVDSQSNEHRTKITDLTRSHQTFSEIKAKAEKVEEAKDTFAMANDSLQQYNKKFGSIV